MRRQILAAAVAATTLGGVQLLAASNEAFAARGREAIQRASKIAASGSPVATTPAGETVEFAVNLKLPNLAGARSFALAVSSPRSSDYRHFLKPSQWEARFSPSARSVAAVKAWLNSEGLTVESVSADRMAITASGTAAQVERAFGTRLGEYKFKGRRLRQARTALSVPASIAGIVEGVSGISQVPAHRASTTAGRLETERSSLSHPKRKEPIPPPEAIVEPPPCSQYFGETIDTVDPTLPGYPEDPSYVNCGYVPQQVQGAYGVTSQIEKGIDGSGQTVAILDAYAATTLYEDAHHYSELNEPSAVLEPGDFSEQVSPKFNDEELCEASGWSVEQTLDVETVHAIAPGAKILYVGAKNCVTGLYKALHEIVDNHEASIISNSWAGIELLESERETRAGESILLMADGTGIATEFAAGDEGDDFSVAGFNSPDSPGSSPYTTGVGGTVVKIGPDNENAGEVGWSTSASVLCTTNLAELHYPKCKSSKVGTWLKSSYAYGGGGGTSYRNPEPSYQFEVVPFGLAARNAAVTHTFNRVEPDISMMADPATGLRVGETMAFPESGVHYTEYALGGTSLATPMLSGLLADTNQAVGAELGFINPLLYALDESSYATTAYNDILPAGKQYTVYDGYADGFNEEFGRFVTALTLGYEGTEEYCNYNSECFKQKGILKAAPGFDSMTGIGAPAAGFIPDVKAFVGP
ncbi:MAG TPA: S53 family peptidase [Solirubrobacteraceae bacterium]|nr:S53 family peptidase [Solirubrobacteraceae bacterium]